MFPSLVNCMTIDWFLPWPKQALQSVAETFLETIELDNREGIVSICVDMQERVALMAERYKNEMKRFYYVTPTSYLVLIKSFKKLLSDKRHAIGTIINKYIKGLDQLSHAEVEVGRLKEELKVLIPQVKQKQEETAVLMQNVDKQQKEVAIKTKEVEAEETIAKGEKEKADTIEADCKDALAKVEPIYQAAMKAVGDLSKNDITEMKSFGKPPPGCILVLKTLCILYNVGPDKKRDPSGGGVTYDYWEPGKKKVLGGPDLLKRCINYDKNNVAQKIIEELKPIIA